MEQTIEIKFRGDIETKEWMHLERDLWVEGDSGHQVWDILRRKITEHSLEENETMILRLDEAEILFYAASKVIESNYVSNTINNYKEDLEEELCKFDNVWLIDLEKEEIVERYRVDNPKEFALEEAAIYFQKEIDGVPEFKFRPTESCPDRYIVSTPTNYIFHYFYTAEQQQADYEKEKSISTEQEKANKANSKQE